MIAARSGVSLRPEDLFRTGTINAWAMLDTWLNAEARLFDIVGAKIAHGPFAETFITSDRTRPWFALDSDQR